jgi:acetolactate synthase-1/2/3 large subunit
MKGADIEAQILQLEEVKCITLYPDIELTDAAAQVGIRTIMPRTERVAVDIANGLSRVSNGRTIGVCTMQPGAGIQNAYAGVAQAWADSSPILVLPEVTNRRLLHTFPSYNAYDSYRNISKWSDTILFSDQIPDLMRRAFTLLRTGRPGPVVLELPGDVAREEYSPSTLPYTPVKGWKSAADARDVEVTVRALTAASDPVIYAGQGVLYAEAWDELKEFSELLQIPVLTSMTGKSAYPENHPLSLGVAAHVQTPAAKHFLAKADLVFAIGAGLSRHWMQAPIPAGKTLIQLTNCEFDIGKGYTVNHALLGDAKLVLQQLIQEVHQQGSAQATNSGLTTAIAEKKQAWWLEWSSLCTSSEIPINPLRVIWDLMHTIDREHSIVTPESGKSRDHASTTYEVLTPRGYLGFGHTTTLGFTLGCAMGAKLAQPEKLVVNIMGDGAFGMVGMDIETSVREDLPILTILLNNSTLSTIGGFPTANKQYQTGSMTGNYADMAETLGVHGQKVEHPDNIIPSIKRAITEVNAGHSAFIEVITKLETKVSR